MNNSQLIEESHIEEFVKNMISGAKTHPVNVENAIYHHNTKYENAPFNIRNGLMSTMVLMQSGRVFYTPEQLSSFENDEATVNGIHNISLSVLGLNDQYRDDDEEYNPLKGHMPDILISSDIIARRKKTNYFNEYLSENIILPDKFKSVDIRIIKVSENAEKVYRWPSREARIKDLKEMYNQLSEIAIAMKETGLDIPLREMSYEDNMALDIDKVASFPKISLIKK